MVHVWIERVCCPDCGTVMWTTPGSDAVVCFCGGGEIQENTIIHGDAITDEDLFKAAVASELRVDVEDLTLEHQA